MRRAIPGGRWDRRRVKRPAGQRRLGRNNWKALAERRALKGLTSRGTVPRRRLEGRLILAEVDALAAELNAVWFELPARVQARCIALAGALAAVRKRLV